MDKRILTDSDIVEAVNESVDTNIVATIVVGAIVLVIFIIVLWEELRNPNSEQGSGSDGGNHRKRKTILGMAAFFLFIVGMPILFRWNSYKKLSGDDWHVEETVVTKKIESRDYDTDTGWSTYTYSIFVEGYSRAIADIPKSKYTSVSKGDEVYVVVDDSTGWIYDFYPMDSYIYNGE